MKIRRKTYFATVLTIAVCCGIISPLIAQASEKGYSYTDPNLVYNMEAVEYKGEELFQSKGNTFHISSEDSSVATAVQAVQIWAPDWSKGYASLSDAVLLQQDLYESTVTGLPTYETGYSKADEGVNNVDEYSFWRRTGLHAPNMQAQYHEVLGNPMQYLKYNIGRLQLNNSECDEITAEEITFGGYPAVITRLYREYLGDEEVGIQCTGNIYIWVTEIPRSPEVYLSEILQRNEIENITFPESTEERYKVLGECYIALELSYNYGSDISSARGADKDIMIDAARSLFDLAEQDFKDLMARAENSIRFETKKTMDIKVKNYKPKGSAGLVNTSAEKEAGETNVSIPAAFTIVIIGAGAALAGAGASDSGGNGGDNKGKKKSRYKMCLRKSFGDAIRYDKQPVSVYARMVEITLEGKEIDRPDLTASLEIFSGGNLTVEGNSMAGNYMGALVSAQSVPGGQNPSEGIVSIRFNGEGDSFQNNVTFRLIGKPYISFLEQGKYLTMTLPMLLGDGETYKTPFILNDFLDKPTSVKLEVVEDVPLNCEIEELEENQYILKVKNNSSKTETHQAVKQTFSIGIRAENHSELAENNLNVELYPEGLSIRELKFDEKGYAFIETFDNENTEEWGDVLPTGFVIDFVVPEADQGGRYRARVMEPEEFSPVFARLKGTDDRTNHLAERLKYTIEEITSNLKEYKFAPQEALVEEEGKPYYLTLPISCSYGDQEYILDLPVRLLGGGPGPMDGWDEEFSKMKRIVSRVGGINPEIARMLRENGKKMSTAELRLVNKRICQDAIVYYTKDASEYEKIAAELDNMIYYAEWLKWFGDQAFSYLISTYHGNKMDAILSPAKDIFATLLGEIIGQLAYGEQIDYDTLEVGKNINAAFDNLITNAFDDKIGKKVSFKQACVVVGGFLVWKIAKNIYDNIDKDGKADLYSAITATTSDLTAMGMKKIAGNFFDKALKNKVVQDNLSKPLGKWLQNIVPDTTLGKWSKDSKGKDIFKMIDFNKSDIFQKYLEEFFGMGMVKVTEIDMAAVKDLHELTSGGSIQSTVDLSAWPKIDWSTVVNEQNGQQEAYRISINLIPESLGKLYDYLFGELFGNIPFAKEEKQPPVDPPYNPEGNIA
ncbi:hypothetical protein SAMN05660462_01954 [Proteiniborus ethanoligenes]|uniref:Uncharacterized protein n=1 Tax=Proteiniborus ethanoligenes TaxID=415015 RepID=A0A1H3QHQ7_9FIRM|nr:hypothetical protein [Proteiniborus ethanoligenes]SDZ12823.1 hypothetical protein SAMN05660462_01954 [Proteiniborus ethanoligenes]